MRDIHSLNHFAQCSFQLGVPISQLLLFKLFLEVTHIAIWLTAQDTNSFHPGTPKLCDKVILQVNELIKLLLAIEP
ncbi:hypothetical protein P4V33_09365 [Brevibacillus borstelensis]|uniref:hypothetical protein n=1 Tax=Brevibacillus borstelensis TaxID=45462 RepID=UPI002E204DF6|nr:hypothetical protein [Brevibacillus borstelensis]